MSWNTAREYSCEFGGVRFLNCIPVVDFNGLPLITVKKQEPGGRFGIDMDIYDEVGAKVGTVTNGYLRSPSHEVEIKDNIYQIVERESRLIIFQMIRNPHPKADLFIAANLYLPELKAVALRGTPYALFRYGWNNRFWV